MTITADVNGIRSVLGREVSGLHRAALILGASSLFSQILALVRDRLLAHTFGAGAELDTYYAAFRVPDLLYASIASFVSVTVLVPIFFDERKSGDLSSAYSFLNQVLTVFSFVMISAIAASFFSAPFLARAVAPGFDAEALSNLILLMRIMLLSPLLLGLSGLVGVVTQTFRKFYLYAISPILYNLGIISGVIFLAPKYGLPGLAWGVIIGAFLHLAVQIPTLAEIGYAPHPARITNPAKILKTVKLSLPRTAGLALSQVVIFFLIQFASKISEGSITIFQFAYNLQSVPLALIGASYSVAAFPSLAENIVSGRRDRFRSEVVRAARHLIFFAVPLSALFVVFRAPIVNLIFATGRFSEADSSAVSAALALLVISTAAQGLTLLFTRSYYAAGETRKPLAVNILSALGTILLVFLMPRTVPMLALAFSAGMIFNAVLHLLSFNRDFGGIAEVSSTTLMESLVASVAGGVVGYLLLPFIPFFAAVIASVCVMAAVFAIVANKEWLEFMENLCGRK